MFSDASPDFAPNFTTFSWGDKQSSMTVDTPKSDVSMSRPQKAKSSRRRIVRACMRCRLRKTKCDGGKPCTRCTEADDVCEYMKCSKKESKEYSQDYVDRLLEMNDKYKTAMRILYANRRLSIQPDNIIIPSTESDDVPLVHDILDRLGMVDHGKDSDEHSESTESHAKQHKEPAVAREKTWSTPSMPSPSNSAFNPSFFDESFTTMEPSMYDESPVDPTFSQDVNAMPLDTDMGLTIPFEAYSTMGSAKNFTPFSPDFPQTQDMSAQDWCPLSVLDSVMNGDFPVDQSRATSYNQLSY